MAAFRTKVGEGRLAPLETCWVSVWHVYDTCLVFGLPSRLIGGDERMPCHSGPNVGMWTNAPPPAGSVPTTLSHFPLMGHASRPLPPSLCIPLILMLHLWVCSVWVCSVCVGELRVLVGGNLHKINTYSLKLCVCVCECK